MPYEAESSRHVAAEVLRNTAKKQGQMSLYGRGAYCAIGVLASEVLGFSDAELSEYLGRDAYDEVSEFLGVHYADIYERNDGVTMRPHTFSEVADWLESL